MIRVADLALPDRTWDTERLNAWFGPEDRAAIRRIPGITASTLDALRWHHNRNGEYSAKSGYWVASEACDVAEPSAPEPTRRWWSAIWRLHLPPKVRFFLWKVCRGWLPTTATLSHRGMEVDPRCPRCGKERESVFHALWSCRESKQAWKILGWWRLIKDGYRGDMVDFLTWIQDSFSSSEFEAFVMIMWSSWNHRNAGIHSNTTRPVADRINLTLQLLEDFRASLSSKASGTATTLSKPTRWSPPPPGTTAINTDAAFSNGNSCGFGGVLRSSTGHVKCCFFAQGNGEIEPLIAEELAIKRGLRTAIDLGLKDIEVQTDCLTIPTLLAGAPLPITECGAVLEDIKLQLSLFYSATIIHTSRKCNTVAHLLAKMALNFHAPAIWYDYALPGLWESILADFPN